MTAAAELAELHLDDDAPVNNNNNNTAAPNNLTDNPLHHDDEASNHIPPTASSPGRSAGGGPQPEADDDDKEESSEQAVMVPFLELFRYATSSSEKLMIATAFFFAAVAGLAMPAFALVFGDLLNSFNQSDDEDDMIDKVSEQAYRFVVIGVISLIAGTVGLGLFMWSSEVRTKRLREEFLQAVLAKDVGWFDSHKPREVAAQMAVDSLEYHNGTGEKIFTGTMHACTFVAGLVIGFVRGWELTLLVLGCTPLMMISLGIFMNVVSVWGKKVAEAYARAGAIADETVASLRTVQAYSGEKRELKRYEAELGLAKEVGQKRYLAEGLALGCTDAVIFSSYGLCLWFGAWLIREDRGYDGGDVISVFFAVLIGAMSIAQVGPALQSIAAARSAAARMFAVIDEPPAFQTQWTRGEGKEIEDMRGALELRDVEFSYPTRPDEVVLRGVSLRIEPGQVVALVGESGSGKSTTCALLQRFYDPLAGQVLVDGVPLQELNLRFWRDSVAFVSQDAVVFTGTVRENIAMGKEGATDEEIIAAAKAAHVHEFVKKLPKGYDTHVGEDGSSLSGGQKQRVAIARAIVRDPKVLLLDEATSALSETDQALVQEALNRLMENRTTLVIAHRLSTVRSADLICVLEHGEIVERGTHEDLMAKKGHYHRLQVHGQMAHAEQKNIESMLTLGADDAADDDEARATSGDHDRDASSRRQSTADAFGIRNSAEMAAVGEDGDEDPVDLDKAGVWADAPDVPTMRVVKMTVKLSPLYVALGFVGGAAIGVIWPLWAVLFADMTELLYYEDEEKQEDESRLVALLFFALGVGICVARVLNIGGFGRVGEVLTEKLRSDTFDALVHQEQGFFDRPENNKKVLLARLHQDTNAVHGGATQRVGLGVRIAVTIVTALVIAFVKAWQLAFVVILVMPMIAIGSSFQMKMLTGYTKEAGKSFEQAGRISGQALDSIRVVAAYCLERRTLDTFSAALAAPLETAKRAAFGAGFGFGCAQFVIFATYGLNFYVGGLLVKEGEISYNGMFSAIFAIVMAGVGIGQATEFAPDAVAAVRARNNIFFLLDRASPIDARDTSCSEAKLNGEGTVELDNVSFAYPTRPDTNVLERCSLRVERGQTLALVGPSGHGKSTVVSLLMRFYDVLDGAVRVDGKDVREVDVSVLRQQIGLVSQNPDLFDASVRENILYGAPEGTTEEDMVEAAKQANIHDTIVGFHDGYDTPVGPKGGKLSGGQRQRVALARALVRKPSILVLDEATSALDAQSQEVVRQALLALMEAKLCTTIVIAHRLSTVQRCDQIAVIANGGVAELGTHEELVQQGGLYAGLVHAGEQSAE